MTYTDPFAIRKPQPILTEDQEQRAVAADRARNVLRVEGEESVDATDVVNVARWIYTGADPYTVPDPLAIAVRGETSKGDA